MGCCVQANQGPKEKEIRIKQAAPQKNVDAVARSDGLYASVIGQNLKTLNGQVVEGSMTNVDQVYIEIGMDGVIGRPGNDQGSVNPKAVSENSYVDSMHKRGSAMSDRSRNSTGSQVNLRHKKASRLGVDNREYLNIIHGRDTHISAPECVRANQDVLQKLFSMDPSPQNQAQLIKIIKKLVDQHNTRSSGPSWGNFEEIVHIRGLSRPIEDFNDLETMRLLRLKGGNRMDLNLVDSGKETTMWNPMHFAVYSGHLEVVKLFKESFKINIGKTAPSALAQNEGEAINEQERFIEDKVYLLQMAIVRQKNDMLKYLLNEYSSFWPTNIFWDWFANIFFRNSYFSQEHFLQVIRIFFKSKTCRSVFGGLTAKKQRQWISDFINQIESTFDPADQRSKAIRHVTLLELTEQPFAGQFLTYQIFDESSNADEQLMQKALANCVDFDFIQFLNMDEIFDAEAYFDQNKQYQLKDKLISPAQQGILQKFISKCISLCKKYNIQEYIRQANSSLVDLAKDPRTTPQEFQEAASKLKSETGYDIWPRLAQVRGSNDTIRLQMNKKFGRGAVHDPSDSFLAQQQPAGNRDSFTLQLVSRKRSRDAEDSLYNGEAGDVALSQSTEKWNPVTFAIYNGNLDLIKFLIKQQTGNTQRLLKIPGIFKAQEVSRLFPFVIALRHSDVSMFQYFWDELAYVYATEDCFESLFRLLAKREQSDMMNFFLRSRATRTLFLSMSFSYRAEFVDHILDIKGEILKELTQMVIEEENMSAGKQSAARQFGRPSHAADSYRNSNFRSGRMMNSGSDLASDDESAKERQRELEDSKSSFDPQEFLFEKKRSLEHFFTSVYEQLSLAPYSLQFYLSLPKYMVRQDNSNQEFLFELLRRTLRNISDDQIDQFIYYDTESAMQIVNDLLEKRKLGGQAAMKLNKIDNEMKNMATRITKSSNYAAYKSAQIKSSKLVK